MLAFIKMMNHFTSLPHAPQQVVFWDGPSSFLKLESDTGGGRLSSNLPSSCYLTSS